MTPGPEVARRPAAAVRHAYEGAGAAAAAVLAMAGAGAAGLLLLGAAAVGRVDRLTAAVVAMAAGAPAQLAATLPGKPVSVHGRLDVMPLGVTLVGAVVLGVLMLRGGRDGLLARGAAAVVVLPGGLGVLAWAARGSFTLPAGGASAAVEARGCPSGGGLPGGSSDALQGGFAVAVLPAVAGAAALVLGVVTVCWTIVRFPAVGAGLRALRWPVAGSAIAGAGAAWAVGGPAAAGGVVLALPLLVGSPWTMHVEGVVSCAVDGGRALPTGGPSVLLTVAVVLVSGLAVAAGTGRFRVGGPLRRAVGLALWLAPAAGVVLAVLAVLSRVSVGLGAQAFILSVPLLDLRLAADPWLALLTGLGAGAVSGLMGSLLVDAFVGWRAWRSPARR
ncbi:hypothetical protein [Actinoplanes sp. M2I2]|uniref:hypothetical protein n=1 Tax=Actinoplanes sp. M2I2 TaxID=1734444 RepID=UPI00201FF62D|nr:hypothetical protein [Actinoplanes sp. M2I2]